MSGRNDELREAARDFCEEAFKKFDLTPEEMAEYIEPILELMQIAVDIALPTFRATDGLRQQVAEALAEIQFRKHSRYVNGREPTEREITSVHSSAQLRFGSQADAVLALPALANAGERARVAEAELRSKDPAYTPLLDKYVSDIQAANDQVEALTRRVAELEGVIAKIGPRCPFGDESPINIDNLEPEDPCPICGDLGTKDADDNRPSRCVDAALLPTEAARG